MRAETGVMKFDDDWPGVFIRGDDAAYFALCLRMVLDGSARKMHNTRIAELALLLESSNVQTKPVVQNAIVVEIPNANVVS